MKAVKKPSEQVQDAWYVISQKMQSVGLTPTQISELHVFTQLTMLRLLVDVEFNAGVDK